MRTMLAAGPPCVPQPADGLHLRLGTPELVQPDAGGLAGPCRASSPATSPAEPLVRLDVGRLPRLGHAGPAAGRGHDGAMRRGSRHRARVTPDCGSTRPGCGCSPTPGCPPAGRSWARGSRSPTTRTCAARCWTTSTWSWSRTSTSTTWTSTSWRGLPRDVPVVVPRYPRRSCERRLARRPDAGTWSSSTPGSGYPLGDRGDWLTVIPEQCPMSHDAAVLFSVGGHTRAAHQRRPDLAGPGPSGHGPRSAARST